MERKTMTADEIREQFNLSKQALTNYLNLGVLTPIPGTEDSKNPLYYTDEVAVIREALTSCQSSLSRLNSIRLNVLKEIDKANITLATLHLDAITKDKMANTIIDTMSLFVKRVLPQLDNLGYLGYPFGILENTYEGATERAERILKLMEMESPRRSPQDFHDELRHEVEVLDVTSFVNCLQERDALQKENENLKNEIEELKHKIAVLTNAPESKTNLAGHGFVKELTEKQVTGLRKDVFDCGFTVRVLNCLKAQTTEDYSIDTLKEVAMIKTHDLKRFRNFGKNSLQEIIDKLEEYDLTLGMEFFEANGKIYTK